MTDQRPSCFLIFAAVLGSISRDGTVVTRSPTQTIIWLPFPRRLLSLYFKPRCLASFANSLRKRERLFDIEISKDLIELASCSFSVVLLFAWWVCECC
jgi:hypothetical protein